MAQQSGTPGSPLPGTSSSGFYNFQKTGGPTGDSQSAAAAAHFYHYYYYYQYYYHNQHQQQQIGGGGQDRSGLSNEDLYASPYILARHYVGNGDRGDLVGGGGGGLGGGGSLVGGWTNSNPVGPVAGAVLAVFIVLLLGIYCLRHQAANRARHNAAIAEALAAELERDCAVAGLLNGNRGGDKDHEGQSGCGKTHSVSKCVSKLFKFIQTFTS